MWFTTVHPQSIQNQGGWEGDTMDMVVGMGMGIVRDTTGMLELSILRLRRDMGLLGPHPMLGAVEAFTRNLVELESLIPPNNTSIFMWLAWVVPSTDL